MPTLDALEYERFSYDEANQETLSLDEAIRKAQESRRSDPGNFYRVEIVDEGQARFRVKMVPASSVYAEFLSRVARFLAKYSTRVQSR